MNTKGQWYPKSIILQAVYFKLRFTLSYRDVEEIMKIRGVFVDRATIQRLVYKFTPFIESEMNERSVFLIKAISNNCIPRVINIDKSGYNTATIKVYNNRSLSKIRIRQCTYLNNIVEQDHRFIKWKIKHVRL